MLDLLVLRFFTNLIKYSNLTKYFKSILISDIGVNLCLSSVLANLVKFSRFFSAMDIQRSSDIGSISTSKLS
ncbi:MAG: hypothetical protein ACTJLM_03105 [Ehrlichia sp.]